MGQLQVSITVEVPQLDALCQTLEKIGAQCMADFNAAVQVVGQLQSTVAQIVTMLRDDTTDQAQLDQLVANLQNMQQQLANAVPEAPPPPA